MNKYQTLTDESEGDLVTALWKKDLEHIRIIRLHLEKAKVFWQDKVSVGNLSLGLTHNTYHLEHILMSLEGEVVAAVTGWDDVRKSSRLLDIVNELIVRVGRKESDLFTKEKLEAMINYVAAYQVRAKVQNKELSSDELGMFPQILRTALLILAQKRVEKTIEGDLVGARDMDCN